MADGWTKYKMSSSSGEAYVDETSNRLGGSHAQRWWSSYNTHDAGIYQRVSVQPNASYTFSAWTWRSDDWNNGGVNQQTRVGLDPFGGTDPQSAKVRWSSELHSYRTYTRQTITATARANSLTVFVRGKAHFAGQAMQSIVDDALLAGPAVFPLGLSAVPGNRQVRLSWYGTVPGATYRVSRATSSTGPFSVVVDGSTNTTYLDAALVNGTTYFYIVAALLEGTPGPAGPLVSARPSNAVTLIPAGSTWLFLVTGQDPGSVWRRLGFDDSGWPTGPARLGYGGDGELTVLGFGPDAGNKYPTAYFRHHLTVANPSLYESLTIGLQRDDGAVVYLNDQEVFRSNMPAGSINYSTWADSTVGDDDEVTFFTQTAPANLLVPGDNVVAVEVHQRNATSSDLGFDLELAAELAEPVPDLHIQRTNRLVEISWFSTSQDLRLESSSALGSGAHWSVVTAQATVEAGWTYVTLLADTSSTFFRLVR